MATRIDGFYDNLLFPALDDLSQRYTKYTEDNPSIQVGAIKMVAWVVFKRPAEEITQESPHIYSVIDAFPRDVNPSRLNEKLRTWAYDAMTEVFDGSPQDKQVRYLSENDRSLPFAVHLHLDLFNEDMQPIHVRFGRNLIDATEEETSQLLSAISEQEDSTDPLPQVGEKRDRS